MWDLGARNISRIMGHQKQEEVMKFANTLLLSAAIILVSASHSLALDCSQTNPSTGQTNYWHCTIKQTCGSNGVCGTIAIGEGKSTDGLEAKPKGSNKTKPNM